MIWLCLGREFLYNDAMKQLSIYLALFFALALAGCNTIEGFGQDMEAAGEAISNSADEAE